MLADLEHSERWSRDRLLEQQRARQTALLRHAFATVPHYRETWSAVGLDDAALADPAAWTRIPPLEKRMLQEQADRLLSSRAPAGFVSATSGSAGTPVSVIRSHRSWAHHHANIFRGWRWFGLAVGEPHAYFWGRALDEAARRKASWRDRLFNRERCSAFTLDDARAREFYALARRRPMRFAYGYPSALAAFAGAIAGAGLDGRALGWRAAVTTAEVLHDHQRERIASVLGCAVADSYGCAEVGVAALECPEGSYHVPVESVVVEHVPGESGAHEVLLTDLHNYSQPVIRYRVGDTIDPAPGPCGCGRPLPVVGRVQGRAGGIVTLPDGRRINANLPSYVFKHHGREGTVREYQFVHFAGGRVELRITAGPAWNDAVRPRLAAEVREALGVDVDVRVVPRFERRGVGKHKDWVRAEEIGEG